MNLKFRILTCESFTWCWITDEFGGGLCIPFLGNKEKIRPKIRHNWEKDGTNLQCPAQIISRTRPIRLVIQSCNHCSISHRIQNLTWLRQIVWLPHSQTVTKHLRSWQPKDRNLEPMFHQLGFPNNIWKPNSTLPIFRPPLFFIKY